MTCYGFAEHKINVMRMEKLDLAAQLSTQARLFDFFLFSSRLLRKKKNAEEMLMCGLSTSVFARMVGGFLHFPAWLPRGKITWFLQDRVGGTLIGRAHCNN